MEPGNVSTTVAVDNRSNGHHNGTAVHEQQEDVFEHYIWWMVMVAYPIVVVVGLVGNSLSAVIMNRPSMKSSTAVLMTGLAVSDSLMLIINCVNEMRAYLTGRQVMIAGGTSRFFCSGIKIMISVSCCSSAWFVVFVSVQRLIIVYFPLRAKYLCSRKKAIVAALALPLVMCAVFTYNVVAFGMDENGMCTIKAKFQFWMTQVDPWLYTGLYCFVPVAILVINSSLLIIRLKQMKSTRKEMTSQQTDPARNENKITVMVVAICVLFVALTTPVSLVFGILSNTKMLGYMETEVEFYISLTILVALINHAVNFLLYAVTSSNFREELKNLVWGNKVCCGTCKDTGTKLPDVRVSFHSSGTKQSDTKESVLSNFSNHI